MSNVSISYDQKEKCTLEVAVEELGSRAIVWDSGNDFTQESVSIANGVALEIIYQAKPAPYLVLGVDVGHGTVVKVQSTCEQDGYMVAALADGKDNYGEPFMSEPITSGECLSREVTA